MALSSKFLPDHILSKMPKDARPEGAAGMTRPEIAEAQEIKSERELQNQIASYLSVRDIFFGRQRMDKRSNMTLGWPDFAMAYKGVPIALECKVGTGKQSEEQAKAQVRMEANGWRYFEVRSLAEVKIILDVFSGHDFIEKVSASSSATS